MAFQFDIEEISRSDIKHKTLNFTILARLAVPKNIKGVKAIDGTKLLAY